MPQTLSYPGVYIEEAESNVRTIMGVATSITAFVGAALRGPVDEPVTVDSFGAFVRRFGGLSRSSPMSYAVSQYFQNGGGTAIIVRVHIGATEAGLTLAAPGGQALQLKASSPGKWGANLRARVAHSDASVPDGFTIEVEEIDRDNGNEVLARETLRNLSVAKGGARYVGTVLEQQSALVRLDGSPPDARPNAVAGWADFGPAVDGNPITAAQISDPTLQTPKQGLWALDKADLVNIVCVPPLQMDVGVDRATHDQALAYARSRRAIYLVDPPFAWSEAADPVKAAEDGLDLLAAKLDNGAVLFPALRAPDPLQQNRLDLFAPSGAVAGVIARTDATRGVWKSPAGLDAALIGVPELAYKLTDHEHGRLNPRGINCLRSFPGVGNVVWGARTLRGDDRLASQWKYLAVRRTAYFIEETLYRSTQWVVFEPNDEALWAQIRLNIGAFMQDLFQQGAFAGKTPREAYLVKCDAETTPPEDVDKGLVNILVGFRPLKPAEFVVIRIQQLAGQGQV